MATPGSQPSRESDRVRLLIPLIVLVLAATAIPVEVRAFDFATVSWQCNVLDVIANLAGYVPLGVALARFGFWRAITIATSLSLFAETCQFFMMHRFPSPIDLAANVTGAVIGLLVGWPWGTVALAIRVNARTAWLSVLAALAIIGLKAILDRKELFAPHEILVVNCRGATLPGSLEAAWTFDESVNGVVLDSSGNGLDGKLVDGAMLADGFHGMAVYLDGKTSFVDFGAPLSLRFMGSLTIMAWIKATSFPRDDAAIVSSHWPGFQLDTTVDRGPRTIGFKLVDPCGNLMIRYGATELARDTWYHVAGVYDADARTLNVYLNGRLDNDYLLGTVASVQQASGQHVCVGRRADARGYEFAGLLDDIRIDSRALRQPEIEKAMLGGETETLPPQKAEHALASEVQTIRLASHTDRCHQPTRSKDAHVPLFIVAVGMLSALACAGFWPRHVLPMLAVSLVAGLLLGLAASMTLPFYVAWTFPLMSLAGGVSVAVSMVKADHRT